MASPAIRGVSFDLWVTLIRSDPGFKRRRNEHLRALFAPHLSSEQFDVALREHDKQADVLAEQTGTDYGFTERLLLLSDALGLNIDPASPALGRAHAEQERLTLEFHPHPYHPDLPALVADLATHVPVAVTSNTGMLPGVLMRRLLARAGFDGVFSHLTFSNEVGVCKPKGEIFAHTYQGLAALVPDLRPEEVLHVGDNPVADIEGGAAFGMQTALVNAPQCGSLPINDLLTRVIAATSEQVTA